MSPFPIMNDGIKLTDQIFEEYYEFNDERVIDHNPMPCDKCKGKETFYNKECDECNGTGINEYHECYNYGKFTKLEFYGNESCFNRTCTECKTETVMIFEEVIQ